MTNPKIAQALNTLFDKQRLVFWYDTNREFRDAFNALDLPEVEKVELANNEFTIKYRMLRQQPDQKFLIYHEGPEPEPINNWLLDVQLASGSNFRTDQVTLWLAELDLGPGFYDVLKAHSEFFESSKRRQALAALLSKTDSPNILPLKMVAVCAAASPRLDDILQELLTELASERDDTIKLLTRCRLDTFLWDQILRVYGYHSESPGMQDFVIALFKSCFVMESDPEQRPDLSSEALVFLNRWKDSRTHEASFRVLSRQCENILQMEERLHDMDFRNLLTLDIFELIERKILSELVRTVVNRSATATEISQWIRARRTSHWFEQFRHEYSAIDVAATFIQVLDTTQLDISSLADGVQKYTQHWWQLDQLYRSFIYHQRESGQASLLGELNILIENLYTNNYVLRLNDRWQHHIDAAMKWDDASITLQRDFFNQFVLPFLDRKSKVCVVISDALRYEVGQELQRRIRQEDRFDADVKPMLSMLPSYTQLGMAALLPHKSLTLTETGAVLADGQATQGTENRSKVLARTVAASTCIQAKDLMALNRDESRTLMRDHDVVYVYHNLIDKTGDTRDTEERVFAAAEETLQELVRITKKLSNANASNVLITADHGFIYQHRRLDDSDFITTEPQGDNVQYRDRRFILGSGLHEDSAFKHFTSAQLGLEGAMDVLIPKSIKRLRLQGSGSRFVHGGATLQEAVIPVIHVNKSRASDVSRVEVDFIGGGNKTITTGQLAVALYQTNAVTDKLQPRRLRIGLYSLEGELLSDQHEITFDLTSADPRDREQQLRLVLSRNAEQANNQQVILKLEELVGDTTHYREYKSQRHTIRRSFTSDFDL